MGKTPLKYFQKIVEFCKKNNIELTCVTTTITPKAALDGVSEETGRWFANLCSQNGVRYIDFNLVSLDELERTDDDFADWEGHMMGLDGRKVFGSPCKSYSWRQYPVLQRLSGIPHGV